MDIANIVIYYRRCNNIQKINSSKVVTNIQKDYNFKFMQIIKFNSFITLILVLFLFFTQANGENKKISNGKHENKFIWWCV